MKKLVLAIVLFTLVIICANTAFAAGEDSSGAAYSSVSFTAPTFTWVDGTIIANSVYDPLLGRLISGTEDYNSNPYGLGNANKTGSSPMIKAVPGQTVHGQYMNNTNSCASCHQTHTAAAKDLLFRSTIYYTCTTCHDGTMGFYNVLAPGQWIKDNKLDPDTNGVVEDVYLYAGGGGTFAGTLGHNPSIHLATGALQQNFAPGGYRTNTNNSTANGSLWGSEFSCVSCHSPHGSYSPRLLHYNPNNIGNELPENGGYKRVNIDVYTENVAGTVYYYVGGGNNNFSGRDETPWLYGFDGYTPKAYWTSFVVYRADNGIIDPPAGEAWNDIFQIYYGKAYWEIPSEMNIYLTGMSYIKANIAPATVVNMTVGPADVNGVRAILNYGDGYGFTRFCSACHTDYNNTGSAKAPNGTFSNGHRHNLYQEIQPGMVGGSNNKMTCLTCHYGHGTSQEIQLLADNSFAFEPDINDSSAVKRYSNMSICIKCHEFLP